MSVFLERQEVRKRKGWGTILRRVERICLSVMIVLAGLAALYGLYILVFMGSYFAIDDIVVRGHWTRLDAPGLIEISGVKQGDNLFMLGVGEVHNKLMTNPWVREVAVRRHLPHTLMIAVEEYKPVAVVVKAGGMYYVDVDGVMFKQVGAYDDKDFPFITGVREYLDLKGNPDDGERTFIKRSIAVLEALEKTSMGKRYGVSEISFDAGCGFMAVMERDALEVLLGMDDVEERIARLDRFTPLIDRRGGTVDYILVDEPGRVIVKYAT